MIEPAAVCDVCRKILALPRLLMVEYLQITVGIHPDAFPEWEPPMPIVHASLHLCLDHGFFQTLVDEISEIVGYSVESINQPEAEEGFGHFITAIEIIHGQGRFFNIQINKDDFARILCKFPIFAHILHKGWREKTC